MLVLTRKASESIVIADGIVVTVSRIQGSRVKLAIEAPPTVRVLRQEVFDRIDQEEKPGN